MLSNHPINKNLSNSVHLHNELVSIAGHELRNPLTALSLQIRILKEALKHAGYDPENQGHIVNIANQSEQNVKRIECLLDRMILLLNSDSLNNPQ